MGTEGGSKSRVVVRVRESRLATRSTTSVCEVPEVAAWPVVGAGDVSIQAADGNTFPSLDISHVTGSLGRLDWGSVRVKAAWQLCGGA